MTTSKQYDKLNRLTSISTAVAGTEAPQTPASFGYEYNNAHQRVRATLADGSYWLYTYDDLGQVTSGRKYWADGTAVSGQQFIYGFDTIGNRQSTTVGGSRTGDPVRTTTYAPNRLNQYASRTTSPSPTYVDILGVANPTADVKVSIHSGTEYTAYRKGEYYHHPLLMPNGSAQYPQVDVKSLYDGVLQQGNIFVPPTSENFTPDADGNLISDGRWQYTWDGENRLVKMVSLAGPAQILRFDYDFQSRRIRKRVWNGTDDSLPPNAEQRFIYDGWNLIATLNAQLSTLNQFVWGTDLSGSMQGAGGVGGLLKVSYGGGDYFTAFDGNGNVVRLVNAASRSWAAKYEYGPFGELVRITGPLAKTNPFRFSTKYQDEETDLLYYGYRYYTPGTGRWLGRDPIGERGGLNLVAFVNNAPISQWDVLGLELPVWERRLEKICKERVNFHVGFSEDDISSLGAYFAPADVKITVVPSTIVSGNNGDEIRRNKIDWEQLKRTVEASLGKACIERLTIGSHGGPGHLGAYETEPIADSTLIGPAAPDTGIKDFLKFLGEKMCSKERSVTLMSCRCASGDKGKEFILDLANLMKAPVFAYDEYFGPGPHGNEWLATPGARRPDLVWTHSPYAGSITQFTIDRRGWFNYWMTLLGEAPPPPP